MGKSKEPGQNRLNRRGFLKGAAAGAAGAIGANVSIAAPAPAAAPRPGAVVPAAETLAAEFGPVAVQETAASRYIIEHPNSDFMVDVLRSLDIEYCASNPGSSFIALQESIVNYGKNQLPEFLTCLHEESAVAMAHGYAKIEGKPMMALLHGTVGLLHAAMAIYNAYADRVPVYIVVGSHKEPSGGVNLYHSAQDMGALVRDFVKWDAEAISVDRFAEYAVRAYKIAMTPPMEPVLLAIDRGMQGEAYGGNLRVPVLTMSAPPAGDPNAVREAARMLLDAERPLIRAERLARTQKGMDLLVELAELLEAPVTSSEWMNFPNRHPLAGNGGYEPDVILALEVNDMSGTARAARAAGNKTISVSSIDLFHGSNIYDYGRYAELDIAMAADAEATLPSLIEEVRRLMTSNHRRAIETRGVQVRNANAQAQANGVRNATRGWDSSPVALSRISAELWPLIKDEDWSLVSWQVFVGGWPGRLWNMTRKYQYTGGQGGGGIGYGLPAAVGAALANRKYGRLSINLQTDGDLNYAPGVLWTALHHNIPLLTVMANNRAYHQEVMFMQQACARANRGADSGRIGTAISNPNIDYAALARGYGMYAEGPIESPNDLGPALKRGIERVKAGEPALIDVVTQPR